MNKAYLGIDIGSISTKGVIINEENRILAGEYLMTEGDPIGALKRLRPVHLFLGIMEDLHDVFFLIGLGIESHGDAAFDGLDLLP